MIVYLHFWLLSKLWVSHPPFSPYFLGDLKKSRGFIPGGLLNHELDP